MKTTLTLKPMKGVTPKDEGDTVEYALEDVNGVMWASFDPKSCKVDLEYDDSDEDFDISELIRAIQETKKFQVASMS